MNASFKKIIAGVTAVTLVAMNGASFMASAANFSPTLTYTDVGANSLTSDDTLVIALPANAVAVNGDTVTVYVKDNAGAAVNLTNFAAIGNTANTSAGVVSNAAGGIITFVVTDKTLISSITLTAITAATFTKQAYSVNVLATNGVGSNVFFPLSSDKVQVTATVSPVLNFSLVNTTLALGELTSAGYAAASAQVVLTSNANGGVVVKMSSQGLIDTVTNKEIGVTPVGPATVATTWVDNYEYAVSNGAVAGDAAFGAVTTGNTSLLDVGGTVAKTAMPSTADDTPISVVSLGKAGTLTKHIAIGAKIAADTEAGNYGDTLTFTVTGTF